MKKNNFLKFIYYMFNVDKNEQVVKTVIEMWFGDWLVDKFNQLRILDIKVKTKKDRIDVNILLERPGLLIGKKGETIKRLTEFLTDFMEKKVEVNVVDGDVFRHKNTIYYHTLSRGKKENRNGNATT